MHKIGEFLSQRKLPEIRIMPARLTCLTLPQCIAVCCSIVLFTPFCDTFFLFLRTVLCIVVFAATIVYI